jgi:ribonuclease VapC
VNGEPGGTYVLDASALLALLLDEPGAPMVSSILQSAPALVNTVNYCETLTKLHEIGFPVSQFDSAIRRLPLTIVDTNAEMARYAAALRSSTREAGLSLGDRFCIACAHHFRGSAVTADRSWLRIKTETPIILIR